MTKEIVQKGHDALNKQTTSVAPEEILGTKIQALISDMKKSLSKEENGVAIAAPQVGEPISLFVVSGKVFAARNGEEYDPKKHADKVFINPEITKISQKKNELEEGCLSVRGVWGKVMRAEKVTISYLDEDGAKQTRGASGLLSQIFQHEIDHLNGTLFTEKAKRTWEGDAADIDNNQH